LISQGFASLVIAGREWRIAVAIIIREEVKEGVITPFVH